MWLCIFCFVGMGNPDGAMPKHVVDKLIDMVSPSIGFGECGDDQVCFALIENEAQIRQAVRGVKQMFKQG